MPSSKHHHDPMAKQKKKFLVCSLAGIGDTLIATPLIHELRLNFPDSQIDVLVLWNGSRQLIETNPHLNRVLQHNFLESNLLTTLKFLLRLRRTGYDVSINTFPQSRVEYRIISWIINAKLRVSHQYDHFGWLTPVLIHKTVPHDYSRHCIEQNLDLLKLVQAEPKLQSHHYEVYLTPDEIKWAQEYFTTNKLNLGHCLAIHPGSGRTKNLILKRWPIQYYAILVQQLSKLRPDLNVILLGGPDEQAEIQYLVKSANSPKIFSPHTPTVRHLAALLKHCSLYLSVDNFVMHLAAAMHVPHIIVIESPTWNPTIAPYNANYTLVQNPAVHGRNLEFYRYDGRPIQGSFEFLRKCMEAVSPEAVLRAITEKSPNKL